MKKIAKILALTVCAAGALSLSACSGCAGTVTYKTDTSPNWQIRVGNTDELNEQSYFMSHKEVATYSISLSGSNNSVYSVEYSDEGSYTTTFYAMEYDWSSQDIPEELRVEDTTDYIYVYETVLHQPGAYVMGSERHEFTNEVTTVSYFRSAGNNLLPVYSSQDIKSTAPNSLSPSTIYGCYIEMDRAYETYYSRDGLTAVTEVTRGDGDVETGTSSAGLGTEYSLFDSSSIAVALRSMSQTGTQVFDIYVPVNGASARFQAAWGSSAVVDRNNQDYAPIVAAMDGAADAGYILPGENDEGTVEYSLTPVTLSLVSDMTGPTTTYYYASVTNPDLNTTRSVLMSMEEVVSFNLGTIIYDLTSLECVEI